MASRRLTQEKQRRRDNRNREMQIESLNAATSETTTNKQRRVGTSRGGSGTGPILEMRVFAVLGTTIHLALRLFLWNRSVLRFEVSNNDTRSTKDGVQKRQAPVGRR